MATVTSYAGRTLTEPERSEPMFDLYHLEHPVRPVNIPFLLILLVLASLACKVFWVDYGEGFSEPALWRLCGIYAAATCALFIAKALRPGPRNWLSPDMVFWLVFTMFHLPFVVFFLVGLADYSDKVFHAVDATNRAMLCVVLCGIGFLLGYELGVVGRRQPAEYESAQRAPAALLLGSQALFLVAVLVAALAVGIGLGPAILSLGYGGFTRIERFVGPEAQRWIVLALAIIRIGLTVYVAACIMRFGRVIKGIIPATVLAVTVVFFMLLGARSSVAVMVIPLILGHHYFVRRIRLRYGIPLFAIALLMFGMIGIGRKAESLSPKSVVQAYRDYREDTGVNPFVASLAEAGGSIRTVNVACAYIPETEPYWWGRSIFESLLMVIPNPIRGLRRPISPSIWVTLTATGGVGGERAGWGSSIAMEAYMNFGLIGGSCFMGFVGFGIRRIYDTTLRRPSFLRVCLLLISVTSLALWCRNYSHHFIRPVVWTVVAAWLLWSVFGSARQAPYERRRS